jgi:Flp pilus assembly protein TadG
LGRQEGGPGGREALSGYAIKGPILRAISLPRPGRPGGILPPRPGGSHRVSAAAPGALAVEFALVLPLLLVVVFGVLEFGLILYSKGVITHASREGARLGVTYSIPRKTAAEIEARVRGYLEPASLNAAAVEVSGAGGSTGTPLDVKVTYAYHFLVLPNFITGITGDLTLTAETVMRVE